MKSYKKFLAATLAVMHVLTFSAPAQQINIQEGTTVNVDSVEVNAGETLTINVVDQLGQVCPSCRGILETNNLLNNGAIDIWGILAIIAPTIINNGTITVQGDLLLSNLGINKEQFFAGIAELSKDPALANGYILNTGEIKNLTQGLLAMIASNGGIHNLGTITSNGGAVVLAAGDRASFPLTRDGVLNIDLGSVTGVKGQVFDKDGNLVETNGLVTNAGVLQANGGAVVLQAAGAEAVYDSIINHTGIIEAKSVAQENGKIILKSETGNITVNNAVIDASGYDAGEKGGSIELLTQGNVIVEGNSVLDASGDIGGGSILIGSDIGVTGPITASNVFVGSDVEVKADAITNGNGGKIIVGAEEVALAYGNFSAKGGAQSGNGGFIETSGKEYLDVDGIGIDATATNGEAGTWLLDPRNVEIVSVITNTGSDDRGSFSSGGTKTWTPDNAGGTSEPSQILASVINGFLNAGNNVVINTTAAAIVQAGNISVLAEISKTAGAAATLTLNATNDILISAAIGSATGFILNVVLNAAGGNITVNSSITTGALSGTGSQATSGSITATATLGSVVLNSDLITGSATGSDDGNSGQTVASGGITISAGTSITGSGQIKTGNATITGSSGGTDSATSGSVSLTAGTAGVSGGIGLSNVNAIVIGTAVGSTGTGTDAATTGNITLSSRDEINNGAASTALGLTIGAASGADNTNTSGALTVTTTGAGGNIYTTSASALNVGAISTSASAQTVNISTTGASDLTVNNATESLNGDTVSLSAGTGTLTMNNTDYNVGAGNLTLRGNEINLSGGANSIKGSGSLTLESATAGQSITVGAGADTGAAVLDITSNDIAALQDGFSGITIGRATDGFGTLTQSAATFTDNITLVNGSIVSNGVLTSSGNTVTLTARTGDITDINGATNNVAATSLNANAVTGINLDTTVDNLTASNTGAGSINLDELNGANVLNINAANGDTTVTSATGGLDVSVVFASGTATLTATAGSITDGNGATNNVTATSLNAAAATGIDLDTTITTLTSANVSGTGAIDINDLAGGLVVTSATTNDGAITLNATSGTLDAQSVVAGGTGRNINLSTTTSGDVNVGTVTASADDVIISSAGGITESVSGAITANDVSFTAVSGVSLNRSANTFDSITGTTTSGAIDIADSGTNTTIQNLQTVGNTVTYNHTGAGDVTITGTVSSGDGVTSGGNVEINSSNALTLDVGATISSLAGSGGTVSLGSAVINGAITAGDGDITLSGGALVLDTIINSPLIDSINIVITALRDVIISSSVTTTTGASVTVTADSDLDGVGGAWLQSGGNINSDGDVTITGSAISDPLANGESVRIDAGVTVDAQGDITLQYSGYVDPVTLDSLATDILVNGVVTSSGVGKTIFIDSTGDITTSNNDIAKLNAENVNLKSVDGIDVEINAVNASYNNSTSGNVAIEDMTGGLTITGATNGGSGSTTILTHSPLTIAANMIQAGTINLTAGEAVAPGAGDDLTVGAFTVRSTGGDVNLSAGDNVVLQAGSTVESTFATGAVAITSAAGDNDDVGSVNLAGDVNSLKTLTLNALTTGGLLGLISQTSGALTAVDLVVSADDSATLNQATNNVSTLAATTGGAVTYQDADGLDLKASTIGGTLGVTLGGNLTDSGAVAVTGTTTLTAGANDITLDNANDFSTVNVVSAKDVTIKDINSLTFGDATITGALALTADSDNNTVGSVLTTGITSATSVSLSGGTDLDDVITLNGDVTATAGGVTAQNAATVNLADSVDVTATGGAISFVTNVAQILLNGAASSTNKFDTNSDHIIELAPVTGTDVHLTVESDGDVTLGDVNLGANGDLTVDVDNDDDGGMTGTFGAITANDLSIEGHNAASADENFTFNGAINLTGDYDIGGLGILTYNNDVTAKSITIHDISVRVQLGQDVDLTSNDGAISIFDNVLNILLAGAAGTNIFDVNGDATMNVSATNGITAINNPNLTLNSEGDITTSSVNIGTGTLTLAVDNDADSASTGSLGALTAGTINAGGSGNDNLDFNAAVVANTAGVTISNANNVDFDSTINTATNLTQTAGSGTTTFSGLATVSGNADITTGAIAFSGATGSINSNAGTGAVKLTAQTGGITSGTAASDVTAGSLEAQSANGIDLDTDINNVAFNNTAGAVAIRNTGALTVNSVGALVTSNNTGTTTTLSASSPLTFAVNTTSAGDLTATAGEVAGAGDDLTVNAGVTVKSTTGNVLLQAGDDVNLAATSAVQSDAGSITLTGGFNDLADTFGSVSLGGTVTAATSAIITALIGSVNGGGLVTAATANIDAVTGIGNTTALNTAVSNISADTTNGNVDINNNLATAVDATSLTSGTGTINFDQTGGGNLTVTSATTGNGDITVTNAGADLTAVSVTAGTAAVADGDVTLTTTTIGNIRVGTVNALGDTVNITSSGTIGELVNDDSNPVPSSDINAGTINLTTGGGDIGAFVSFLDITPTDVWNATSNGGDIYVSCIGVCPMGQIDAGTGFFYYSGNITDGNDKVLGVPTPLNGEHNGATWNIRAGGVHLDANNDSAGFIGTASNWIEMRLARDVNSDTVLDANGLFVAAAGSGGIHVSNDVPSDASLGLQIGSVGAFLLAVGMNDGVDSKGGIEIYSFSPLVIAANVIDNSALSIDLVAAGNVAADDLTVNTGVTVNQQGSGTVRLFAGDDINLNGTALVQSTTGTISANAGEDFTDLTIDQDGTNGGSLVMNSNSAFRSQDGNINLTANNHLRISEVNANSNADATIGDVNLNADANSNGVGRIEDRNGANALNVTGDDVTMNAGSGIGVDGANVIDAIETSINNLTLTNTTGGHVAVTELNAGGALNIVSADQQADTGVNSTMTIRTNNGTLTVLASPTGSGVQTRSGELLLSANGGGANDDLVVNNTVTSTTGKINLDSNSRDVIFSAAGDVTATNDAEIEVNATNNITMADGTILQANGGGPAGAIDLDAGNDVTLGSVQTTSAASVNTGAIPTAFNAVDINAGGAVIDGGDLDVDIIANSGQTTINAVNGIGDGNQLDVRLQSLRATNTTANDIRVREMAAGGDLNIVDIDQQATNGAVNVRTQNGSLTVLDVALLTGVAGGVSAVDGVTRLFAQDNDASGTDHLNINNTVTSNAGKINLDSENDANFSEKGDVTSVSGEVEVDALDNINMTQNGADWSVIDSGSGAIDMDAGLDVNLTEVKTTSNGINAVVINSRGGKITDNLSDTNVTSQNVDNITTGTTGGLILAALSGIGDEGDVNGAIQTSVGNLAAVTDTGDIQVFNTGDLTITQIADNDNTTSLGNVGAGTVTGVSVTDTANNNSGTDHVFVKTDGNMTIDQNVDNFDGGDVTLYALNNGSAGPGNMNINDDVRSIGGNGNMRVVSFGDMNMTGGTEISTQAEGAVSGTGQVVVGAGYNADGKARNADMTINPVFAADVLPGLSTVSLATTSTNGAGSLLDTVGNTGANLTMDETARISTEDGQIIVDAQNNFTVGRVDADGNANSSLDNTTDGVRGNILAFARNGSILDAEGPGEVGNLDFLANSLTMLAAGTIGLSSNRIEGTAPFLNTFSIGDQFVSMLGDTQVEMTSASGSLFLNATGTILLGHMSAPSGVVHAIAGGSILSQGGGETRVTAFNLIELIASSIVGTTSNPIHTQLNATPAQINLSAGGQAGNGVSAAIFSNISPLAINMLNNPPGLVLFNGTPVAGSPLPGLIGSQASLYYKAFVRGLRQYGDFDGNYAADFPGFVDYQSLIQSPDLSVDTTALDIPLRGITTAPRVVPIPAPAVPTPVPPVAEQQAAVQPQVPELSAQEPTPPAVVPIPARAQPSDQVTTDEDVPETPAASN